MNTNVNKPSIYYNEFSTCDGKDLHCKKIYIKIQLKIYKNKFVLRQYFVSYVEYGKLEVMFRN